MHICYTQTIAQVLGDTVIPPDMGGQSTDA